MAEATMQTWWLSYPAFGVEEEPAGPFQLCCVSFLGTENDLFFFAYGGGSI
jgi:hypothetical protein